MTETINCPKCQAKLQVPEQFLGQQVQCPTCSNTFVATLEPPAYPPPAQYQPSGAPPPAPYDGDRRRERRHPDDYGDRRERRYDDDEYDDAYDPRRRRRRDYEPHRGSSVLTLGILGLVLCGPILGPIAWVMGSTDLAEMRAGRMDPSGEGMTSAGKICGMIGTIWSIAVLAIWLLVFMMAATRATRW